MTSAFLDALHAEGPAADRADKMALYGQFVGAWDLDVTEFKDDGTTRRRSGEWHFGWALEGRAVQDVWIVPPRGQRDGDAIALNNRYGTTLRVYDPTIDAWRISWFDPGRCIFRQQVGRPRDADIVQEGTTEAGDLTRWSFTEITEDFFHWLGEVKPASATDWRVMVDVRAKRRKG